MILGFGPHFFMGSNIDVYNYVSELRTLTISEMWASVRSQRQIYQFSKCLWNNPTLFGDFYEILHSVLLGVLGLGGKLVKKRTL